ncbi:MAG TPA: sialidase family protein [Pyrinomonadaceae bacterium]|nr:sialidase family protein [Pyrinomonadaceae bacterium]
MKRFLVPSLLAALLAAAPRASFAQGVRQLPSPAAKESGQPNLSTGPDGRVYLSWLERVEGKRFALRFAARERRGWSAGRTVAEGDNWFVNWADFPSLAALPDGSLAAHWLARSGPGVYAYDVKIARSADGGETWSKPFTPHRDGTQTEHGFVSMFPSAGGRLGAVWLDGREMKHGEGGHGHGEMTLRFAALGPGDQVISEALLDPRVCECCQTSAALTSEGVVVVYRDRSEKEVRDISVVRLVDGKWSEPRAVHADGWQIDGCPVNGPSVAAAGRRVAVAWFTMAGGSPRVRLAFSEDAGANFKAPVEVGDGDPVGRADVLLLADGSALVCWVERTPAGAEVRARRVRPDGRRDPSFAVAPSGAARSSGFPQMARAGNKITFAWTSPDGVKTAETDAPAR